MSGQAPAAVPISAINSRRLIRSPRQRGPRHREMSRRLKVRGSGANSLKSARQAVGAECVTSFPALTAPTQPTKSRQLEQWRRDTR
jgi:hypothetical protein